MYVIHTNIYIYIYVIHTNTHTHTHIYMYVIPTNIYIKQVKVKLATVVKGDQKAPFSIATTPRCRGGCYSFPWIAPLYS